MKVEVPKIKIHKDLVIEIANELETTEQTVRLAMRFQIDTPLGDKCRALASEKLKKEAEKASAEIIRQ